MGISGLLDSLKKECLQPSYPMHVGTGKNCKHCHFHGKGSTGHKFTVQTAQLIQSRGMWKSMPLTTVPLATAKQLTFKLYIYVYV